MNVFKLQESVFTTCRYTVDDADAASISFLRVAFSTKAKGFL